MKLILNSEKKLPYVFLYLHYECCQADQRGKHHHAAQLAHIDLPQQKESRPAQLLGSVGGVAHAVDPLHLQLLDQTAAEVAELIEAVAPVIRTHTAVTCEGADRTSWI